MKAQHKSKTCVTNTEEAGLLGCQKMSDTGMSANQTCVAIEHLIESNEKATRLYSKHSKDLKLATDTELTSVSLCGPKMCVNPNSNTRALQPNANILSKLGDGDPLGSIKIDVERTVHVAYISWMQSQVFTVLSHSVRSCGYIP